MADPGDETRTLPPQAPAPSGPGRPARPRGLSGTIWVLEHAQDYVAGVVGVALILLAAVLIVSGLIGFVHDLVISNVFTAATRLLDRLLLVLIVAEIVHTVVLSLRAHRLIAQPFIVVGLVAVIRRILLVLSGETSANTTQLWLLIAMVVAFVAGLIAVSRFEKKQETVPALGDTASPGDTPDPDGPEPPAGRRAQGNVTSSRCLGPCRPGEAGRPCPE